jgi:DNA-directed RNA polymerase subunit H (RpoH/RPB5)
MEILLNKIGKLNSTTTANYTVVLECVLRTCVEMLKDRGYNVSVDCRTVGDITYKIEQNHHVLIGETSKNSVVLYFHNEDRVGVKQLRSWNDMNEGCDIVIVSLEGPTAFTKKEADQYYPNIQFFTFKELCVNITRHSLVPKHEKIGVDEVEYQVGLAEEWPKLYTNDAIAQYYNYKKGDLIRITRTVGCAEPVFYYRLVCSPPSS